MLIAYFYKTSIIMAKDYLNILFYWSNKH